MLTVKKDPEKEAVQLALRGMWTEASDGCPCRVGYPDVARCSDNEMRPCIYELARELRPEGCAIFKDVIHEWQEEYHMYSYESDWYREKQNRRVYFVEVPDYPNWEED